MKAQLVRIILILAIPLALSLAQSEGQEYMVVLKSGESIDALNKAHGTYTIRHIPNTSIYLVRADTDGGRGHILRKLRQNTAVDIADINTRLKLASSEAAPDPSLAEDASSLDGHTLTTFYGTTVLKSYVEQAAVYITALDQARGLSTGAATRVAYIDTGVDFSHPALQPWLDPGIDLVHGQTASELDGLSQQMAALLDQQMASLLDERFSFVLDQAMASLLDGENDSESFPDALGHGTLVAGLIHLVAPETRIVPIKAFDADGNTTMFRIIEGMYFARDQNVDVLNLSFSIETDSPVLWRAIGDIHAAGIAIVSSVGNDGIESKAVYPAAYPQVIAVAATDFGDRRAGFSNYGKLVAVAAPGAYVVSTVPGGRYAAAWGTSFSAPIVSGTVALLASGRGQGQSGSQSAVTTADFIDDLNPGFEKKLGKGRVNIPQALKAK